MNELLGVVARQTPCEASSRQAVHCPIRNPKPSTTVAESQGNLFSFPMETPGIPCTGFNTVRRAICRRAISMVKVLTTNKSVFTNSKETGRLTEVQSRTYCPDFSSSVGK